MGDVINLFSKDKCDKNNFIGSYHIRVDVYKDDVCGQILDMGQELNAEEIRKHADDLSKLSKYMYDDAFIIDEDEDWGLLATANIYRSSRVTTWVSNKIDTQDRVDWIERRLDDAKEGVALEPKGPNKS